MALPSSGSISMSQINTELTNSSTATLNLGATTVRNLFEVLSGSIKFSNGYGKTRVITIPLSFSQGYGSSDPPVYYNLGPYSIIGKTTLTGTSLQTVQELCGTLGCEYHNAAIVDYSYDNSSWTRLVNIGGAGWYNNDPHSRGSTLSTASVSTSVSGTNLYIRIGTWTERAATMTVTGTITIQ
jgi:hypothetical protein